MRCKCAWCLDNRRVQAIVRRGSKEQLREMVKQLSNDLCEVQSDNNYHEANWDGSWPHAVENLTRALERAKAVRAARVQGSPIPEELR